MLNHAQKPRPLQRSSWSTQKPYWQTMSSWEYNGTTHSSHVWLLQAQSTLRLGFSIWHGLFCFNLKLVWFFIRRWRRCPIDVTGRANFCSAGRTIHAGSCVHHARAAGSGSKVSNPAADRFCAGAQFPAEAAHSAPSQGNGEDERDAIRILEAVENCLRC